MVTARTELELREKLAARTETEGNRQARRLCAVSSDACRAGDDRDWFELEVTGKKTYCFCAAHSLAAELGASLAGRLFGPEYVIAKIHELEQGHG